MTRTKSPPLQSEKSCRKASRNQRSGLLKVAALPVGFWDQRTDRVQSVEYIIDQIKVLCRCLVDPKTERVKDMSLWLNYLAYDIMGEVVFGKGFDMLTQTSLRYILPLIDSMVFSMLLVSLLPTPLIDVIARI